MISLVIFPNIFAVLWVKRVLDPFEVADNALQWAKPDIVIARTEKYEADIRFRKKLRPKLKLSLNIRIVSALLAVISFKVPMLKSA